MSDTDIEMLADELTRTTTGTPWSTGVVESVDISIIGGVPTVARVTVAFPAGSADCRWLDGFHREAAQTDMRGVSVLVMGGVILGSIYPRGT